MRTTLFFRRSLGLATAVVCLTAQSALAASSWNPTLLVNTESFQTIDEGDGSTNIVIRFGQTLLETLTYDRTKNRFQLSKGLSVLGMLSGSTLNVDRNATIGGNLTASGTITTLGAVNATGNITTKGTLSGNTLRASGSADIHGPLAVSGAIRGDGNLTINDDADSNDAVLTFGNASGNQTLKFLNATQRFEFSRGIRVLGTISGSTLVIDRNATVGGTLTATGSIKTKGNLSGSTLTVDGNLTLHGVTYSAPSAQGGVNTFLKNDGAGNLTWGATASGNGSGGIMSLHPQYPNAVFFSSGSTYVGQLSASGTTSSNENFYHWTSSKAALNDYWLSVRVRLPDNFSSWDPIKPIELRYRTGDASAANNHVTMRIKDTGGTLRTLTGGNGLASTSFATANITGPESTGTWAAKGYITILIKVAANSTAGAYAEVGFLNLNFETTVP